MFKTLIPNDRQKITNKRVDNRKAKVGFQKRPKHNGKYDIRLVFTGTTKII